MNKTIDINIGGIFFHIDEIAYQKLKKYLDTIRQSLNDHPEGKDEIIADIELRISELLSDILKDDKQVVSLGNIDEIIKIMGQPEDYLGDEEIFEDDFKSQTSGVKKLFRDGDDKFIGGVASGLAHYVGVEPIWIRLVWLVLIFGMGFGILLYILLWILLPEAKTTSEKLQMKGEAINISNIEKKIKDELGDVGDRIKNADYSKAKSGIQNFFDALGNIFITLFKIVGKFVGIVLVLVALAVIVSLIFTLLTAGTLGFFSSGWWFSNLEIMNATGVSVWLVSILVFLVISIPFLFLFVLGLHIISSQVKPLSRPIKFSFLGLWIVALLGLIYIGIQQASESAFNGVHITNNQVEFSPIDTLKIKIIDDESLSGNKSVKKRFGYKLVYLNKTKKIYSTFVKLDIKKSEDKFIHLKIRKEAEGHDNVVATERAENIDYSYKISNNTLNLDGYFLTDVKNKFRDQEIDITLYIPENQAIYLDKSTSTFLYDVANTQDIYDRNMAKHHYIMGRNGLQCTDCSGVYFKKDHKRDHFKLKINKDGIDIKVSDDNGSKSSVKIDENGIIIK